jgi:O-acetyl-ADP-ribose deacetylase (regulator of RNase III)
LAAEIAVREITSFLKTDDTMEQITLVCYDEETQNAYQEALEKWEAAQK